MTVLDLSDPARPALLGELPTTGVEWDEGPTFAHLGIEAGRAVLAGPGGLALPHGA